MKNCLITISYKQIIDATMPGWFEKGVANSSYEEFLLKSQSYNPENKFKTFQEMETNNSKANSLHYKCGFPIIPFIDLLKNEIQGLKDNNEIPVKFKTHLFQIISSDITNKLDHKISITYFTEPISLIDCFGEFLLLAYGNKFGEQIKSASKIIEDTFLLQIVPMLSFSTYQKV